jgi:hypothetical protein
MQVLLAIKKTAALELLVSMMPFGLPFCFAVG